MTFALLVGALVVFARGFLPCHGVVVSNYTVKATNLTSKFLIDDDSLSSERCSVSHIWNTEFYLAFWTKHDSSYRNINSAIFQNNGELVASFDDDFDPTDGFDSVYSYGIRSTQCPVFSNGIALTVMTFYRKVDSESQSRIYIKLLFSHYNSSASSSSSSSSSNNNNNNNKYDALTLDWSDMILISEMNDSDTNSMNAMNAMNAMYPDVSCIEHGASQPNGLDSVGMMVAWQANDVSGDIYARYLIVNSIKTNTNSNTTDDSDDLSTNDAMDAMDTMDTMMFGDDAFVVSKGDVFFVSNSSNTTSDVKNEYPYVSGRYVTTQHNSDDAGASNGTNSQEMFLITCTAESEQGYQVLARVFQIDGALKNATGYKPVLVKKDFAIAKFEDGSKYVSQSEGILSTSGWNQIALSMGGYLAFYTYLDLSENDYYFYMSYVSESFVVSNGILVSKTEVIDYGELIELKQDETSTAESSNETNIFVLFGNYAQSSGSHSVEGKLYHVRKNAQDGVELEEISLKGKNGKQTNKTSITFETDSEELLYKCAAANFIDNIDLQTGGSEYKMESTDVMVAWTDWNNNMLGKFVNFDVEYNVTKQNGSMFTSTQARKPRTSSAYFTTGHGRQPNKKKSEDGGLDDTSIVFIVVIAAMALICATCVCVFGWLVHKGKINVTIGHGRNGADAARGGERLLGMNANDVQLTSEEINANRHFSAVM